MLWGPKNILSPLLTKPFDGVLFEGITRESEQHGIAPKQPTSVGVTQPFHDVDSGLVY